MTHYCKAAIGSNPIMITDNILYVLGSLPKHKVG